MPSPIYYRLAGNAASLSLQAGNSLVMLSALKDDIIMQDPDARIMASMMLRFITVWNVTFQLCYFALAVTCDLLSITNLGNSSKPNLTKNIEKIRNFFFSALVLPGTMLVFTLFWPLFTYDRDLIYPAFIDKVFSPISSYVIHMAIVPSVLWELTFQPRETPGNHRTGVATVALYYLVYNVLICDTYFKRGLWPYKLIEIVHNGPLAYYIMFHILMLMLLIVYYFLQWPLKDFICGKDKSDKKIK